MIVKLVRWLVGVVVVAAFSGMLWLATPPPSLTIQREISADGVDVSSRVAARIVVEVGR
jgi:HlyD family secretion protein